MADNESTIKVKLWHVLVAVFAIITFVFTFYVTIQTDVNAKQDLSIKEKLGKEQYYRDMTAINKKFDEIMKEIKRITRFSYKSSPGP